MNFSDWMRYWSIHLFPRKNFQEIPREPGSKHTLFKSLQFDSNSFNYRECSSYIHSSSLILVHLLIVLNSSLFLSKFHSRKSKFLQNSLSLPSFPLKSELSFKLSKNGAFVHRFPASFSEWVDIWDHSTHIYCINLYWFSWPRIMLIFTLWPCRGEIERELYFWGRISSYWLSGIWNCSSIKCWEISQFIQVRFWDYEAWNKY